jgi:hypothetical protein
MNEKRNEMLGWYIAFIDSFEAKGESIVEEFLCFRDDVVVVVFGLCLRQARSITGVFV